MAITDGGGRRSALCRSRWPVPERSCGSLPERRSARPAAKLRCNCCGSVRGTDPRDLCRKVGRARRTHSKQVEGTRPGTALRGAFSVRSLAHIVGISLPAYPCRSGRCLPPTSGSELFYSGCRSAGSAQSNSRMIRFKFSRRSSMSLSADVGRALSSMVGPEHHAQAATPSFRRMR